jgi:predicted lipid-binding transport protein (Tim44 family)
VTRISLLIVTVIVVFSLSLAPIAEAKRGGGFGGGYKSPKRTYTQTPTKPADKNVNNTSPGKNTGATNPAPPAGNRGFFSGGGIMRGLIIGGLAGLMFGTLFANMGAIGDLLGLLVNILAIYILFIAIRGIVRYYRNQRRPNPDDHNRRY